MVEGTIRVEGEEETSVVVGGGEATFLFIKERVTVYIKRKIKIYKETKKRDLEILTVVMQQQ